MDLEKLTNHKHYHLTVTIAVVLSAMVVTVASMIGRGALNLKGEVVTGRATTERTAINMFLKKMPDAIINDVKALPVRLQDPDESWIFSTTIGSFFVRTNPMLGEVTEVKAMHEETL